jgi:hypothetical protein
MDICSVWGVPLAEDKTVEPVEVLTFLGIEFDTIRMELRLPKEKLIAKNHILTIFMHSKKISLHFCEPVKSCGKFLEKTTTD